MKIRVPKTINGQYPEWVRLNPDDAFSSGFITADSDIIIQVKIKHILKNENLISACGIFPWCVNEGLASGDDWYDVSLSDCIESGLISVPNDQCYW